MPKRTPERAAEKPAKAVEDEAEGEELEFEDEFCDEFEEEEMAEEGEEDAADEMMGGDGVHAETEGKLWRAGDAMAAGEELDFDSSAYTMLHRLNMEWPCMTFGFVRDNLGEQRTRFPMTAYLVAGTQAERASQNKLVCMKASRLCCTRNDEDEDADDSDDEADEDPIVEQQSVAHPGTVNRLKLMPRASHICATWAETGKVHMWDLSAQLATLHQPGSGGPPDPQQQPLFTFEGHQDEGYAIDFSEAQQGQLATGDCKAAIHVWSPTPAGSWVVDGEPYVGHSASVEDLEWSPVEPNVFLSGSCDSTLRVWDVRQKSGAALCVDEGHGADVNVISWNRTVNYLVASGADDGSFRIWDLRTFSAAESATPVAKFHWHKAPISSIEWSPQESSSLAVAGADNQLTLWDLALEDDPEAEAAERGRDDLCDIPAQLYFVHQGQSDIKELHWHPQLPGVIASTAADSLHVFKPANAGDGPAA